MFDGRFFHLDLRNQPLQDCSMIGIDLHPFGKPFFRGRLQPPALTFSMFGVRRRPMVVQIGRVYDSWLCSLQNSQMFWQKNINHSLCVCPHPKMLSFWFTQLEITWNLLSSEVKKWKSRCMPVAWWLATQTVVPWFGYLGVENRIPMVHWDLQNSRLSMSKPGSINMY